MVEDLPLERMVGLKVNFLTLELTANFLLNWLEYWLAKRPMTRLFQWLANCEADSLIFYLNDVLIGLSIYW